MKTAFTHTTWDRWTGTYGVRLFDQGRWESAQRADGGAMIYFSHHGSNRLARNIELVIGLFTALKLAKT